MREDDKITEVEYQDAMAQEIKLHVKKKKSKNYIETYARYCAIRALMENQGFVFRYEFSSDADRKEYEKEYNELYSSCESSLLTAG